MNAIIPSRRRTGFTLVEVLVVTGILAILFALATGVAIRALITAEEARVTAEMRQLESAITAFKTKYGVSYLPSRFRLYPRIADYFAPANANDPLNKASRDYLFTMWPRLDKSLTIQWIQGIPNTGMDLNGSECLVFFLGGPDGLVGFSKNPANPIPTAGTRGEVSFEFDVKRLDTGAFCMRTPGANGQSIASSQASPAFVYFDGYFSGGPDDQPYYYFTSYKIGNDYDAADAITLIGPSYQFLSAAQSPRHYNLNQSKRFKLGPSKESVSNRFYNPTGFQLISAGRDKLLTDLDLFNGTAPTNGHVKWANGIFNTGTVNYTESVDNLCNFHPAKMGIPQ